MQLTNVLNLEQMEVLFAQWEKVTGVKVLLVDEEGNVVVGEGTPSEYKVTVVAGDAIVGQVCGVDETEETEGEEAEKSGHEEVEALAVVINKMVETEMGRMEEKALSETVHETVQKTSEYIQKINDITKELDKIEKNQKILALNASIEAARAGEAGKGFAIVATNVSTLATNFGNNNREIKTELQKLNSVMEEIGQTGKEL